MKYSVLFGKTNKSPVKASKFKGFEYLVKGGFIAESNAGRWYFLPLGWRVHDNIKKIIKEDIKIEVFSPEQEQFGHYSTNVALKLAKIKGKNPMAIAEEIKISLQQIAVKIFSTKTGANPIEGSSNIKSFGSLIRERAIASICCSPPDNVPPSWLCLSFKIGNNE